MDLLAVSPDRYYRNEAYWIAHLLESGLHRYHLRKPGWSVENIAQLVEEIPENLRGKVVLHQAYRLVEPLGLGGWHLKDHPLGVKIQASLRKSGVGRHQISKSLHDLHDLFGELVDFAYGFLSPIFPSFSKVGHAPAWSMQTLKRALADLKATRVDPSIPKIYALGGISPERLLLCQELGFSGVVVHGMLWEANDPGENFKKFLKG